MAFDNRELELAQHMADIAGDILRRYWRAPIISERKMDLSPVTRADREVESALRALVKEHFPDHGIYGEEEARHRPDAPIQWVIDPIDGTRAFLCGYPLFTTLIALCVNGVPQFGLIDQPITEERWLGQVGKPTTCNDRPVQVRDMRALKSAHLCTTSTFYFTESEKLGFESLSSRCGSVMLGGDAYAYAMLASGHADIVIDAGMQPYDFCALTPVITGAGGFITDWQGAPVTLASNGQILAAATRELHTLARNHLK